ncbi:MAG: rhodanese-like domain-containing protein [Ruminococcus sp.]|nr:rhodanese-like domain-containing protein [Candidatus Apopatosoma intestinale]
METTTIRKISFADAKKMMDTVPELVILDVREEEEYITGHAVGAELLPVDDITAESAAKAIPTPDTPVLLYCRSGARSALAAEKLTSLGYRNLYDVGGLVGWPYGLTV